VGNSTFERIYAIKKAKTEYRKYQEITLSPVEEEYLKSVKGLEKEVKKKNEQLRNKKELSYGKRKNQSLHIHSRFHIYADRWIFFRCAEESNEGIL